MGKFIDLTGQKIGRLHVLKRVENKGKHTRYLCQCDCGQEKIFYATNLNHGRSVSCGCYNVERSKETKLIDLAGQRFGRLTVLGIHHRIEKTRQYYWNCQCDCGNTCVVYSGHLKDGHTSSCGCLGDENRENFAESNLIDLTGQRFGRWTVIKREGSYLKSSGSEPLWLCKCDCGTLSTVVGSTLRNGSSNSCGCIMSLGEELISSILTEHNISFERQYSFSDLKSDKNRKLYFDFCILENDRIKCLLEYQGLQHFSYSEDWVQTREDFEAALKRDDLKRAYCKTNNIPLIEIPYWDFSKLNYEYLKDKIEQAL